MQSGSFFYPETWIELLRHRAEHQASDRAFTYLADGETDERHFTYAQLDESARAIAAWLETRGLQGERALLLYPNGMEFVTAFFGCLYAGVIAVPTNPPRRNPKLSRIESIVEDADVRVALTTQDILDKVAPVLNESPRLSELEWHATDVAPDPAAADQWQMPNVSADTLAFLQYTSGSTGTPKGVMLSHGNLLHNSALINLAFEHTRSCKGVFWLPNFHDMGLIGGILQPLYVGRPNVLMSPMMFLQKPLRWLRAITRYRGTTSGGPNFAYELCVEKITPEQMEELDLSSWTVAFNGAEPVRPETIDRFSEKFAPCGFRREAFYPCFGLAEATLLVTGGRITALPVVQRFDERALARHRAIDPQPGQRTRELVGCGRTLPDQEVSIVDPDTRMPCEEGHVGEVWVCGPSVAAGYWNKDEETRHTFGAQVEGSDEGPFLRTGDLGFVNNGELFVTGRIKDLIIIRGTNHYPQDIERTAEQSHPALQQAGGAAFSVDVDGEEQLVVLHEVQRQHRSVDMAAVVDAIRQDVLESHDLRLYAVSLLKAGSLPKTTSGKVARHACRNDFQSDSLRSIYHWVHQPGDADAPVELRPSFADTIHPQRPESATQIEHWLVEQLAERLKIAAAQIDLHEPFARFGLDSAAAVGISGDLEEWLGRRLSPTLIYSYPTVAALAAYLAAEPSEAELVAPNGGAGRAAFAGEPIAIVGLGCRFPGAHGPNEFWQLMRDGADATGEVPEERWNLDAYYDADPEAVGKMYTRRGAFLEDVDKFDPQFFGIAPREATAMDPQQRLLLEVSWEALEHAGLAPDRLATSETGIFVGLSNSDYGRLGDGSANVAAIDPYVGTGTAPSIAAGRLSYFLGLHGPSMAVDTACSSSLVAVHLAIQSLRGGECRTALAGGVNLILDPSSTIALCKLRALSPDGSCKTFAKAANGYVRGEGCGIVVLKRLSDALADNDRVFAVLKNSAINHDGQSNGLTAPSGVAQEAVIRKAIAGAGVTPSQISYLEAHGTGTELGDPIEVLALGEVFGDRDPRKPLSIGSVKTNVGHLEAAAGVAGLIKVVLALGHGEIPPHLHFDEPSPHVPWDNLPLVVPTQHGHWDSQNGKRLAGVSSFGFSGTNAHLIVEEAPAVQSVAKSVERPLQVLALSAKNDEALKELAARYRDQLSANDERFEDICHTADAGREHFAHRLALTAQQAGQAVDHLAAFCQGKAAVGLFTGKAGFHAPKVAFLFTGQGAQYANMGRTLYETQPTFRRVLDRCDQMLRPHMDRSLLSVVFPDSGDEGLLDDTAYTQPGLFALEYALAQLWLSWGIRPNYVMGHSIGEYVAACVAGVFRLEDALKLIAARGRLMSALPQEGDMVAVMADEGRVAEALDPLASDASIAAINGPEQIVISGRRAAVEQAVKDLERDGVKATRLKVSHAFHSPLMEPMLADFQRVCEEVIFYPPRINIISNVTGESISDEIADAEYWCQHVRLPVRFADSMVTLQTEGCDVYLEIGPKPTLMGLGRGGLAEEDCLWLPSLRAGRDDWQQMLDSLADLYVRGADVNWSGFDADYARRMVDLPTYPFIRDHYWLENVTAGPVPHQVVRRDDRYGATLDDWLFEVQWQPKSRLNQPRAPRRADYLPRPREIAEHVAPQADRLRSQQQLARYRRLAEQLDQLSSAYVQEALEKLGWQLEVGGRFTAADLADQLNVVDDHRRLFGRMLAILAEDGLLRRDSEEWEVIAQCEPTDSAALSQQLLETYPECSAELTLVSACGSQLAGVISGATDPLGILFPNGSAEMVESLYQDSPFARVLNTLVEESVAHMVDRLPAHRPVRILEVGGGTGGTTSQILPRLPADRTEYVFTDVSDLFTVGARSKFHNYPFVRYGVIDIETDPRDQGYADHQFDIIVAANVLHATRDLRETLAHVQQLLAPGGSLVLLEGATQERWLDLIFGLTEGWWRFADTDLRPSHALLPQESWLELLAEMGFAQAVALPELAATDSPDAASAQIMVVAQMPDEISQEEVGDREPTTSNAGNWLICADQGGLGEALAEQLVQRGGRPVLLHAGEAFEQLNESKFVVNPDEKDEFARAIAAAWPTDLVECRGVVHLWSMDAERGEDISIDDLDAGQRLGCDSIVHLFQALAATSWSESPRLWLATRGAQPAGEDSDPIGLAQSSVWGLGRVIAEEHPIFWGGIVDLDPRASAIQSAAQLCEEVLSADDENQLALRGGERFAPRLVRRQAAERVGPIRWRRDASYLVTGGLGDIGLLMANWMVRQGAEQIVLLSRRALPPREHWQEEIESGSPLSPQLAAIVELEQEGARIHVASADVADRQQLSEVLAQLREDGLPPIRGVMHCAGVSHAEPLLEMPDATMHADCRPKVQGTWNLHELLTDPLDFFVLFSSGAAVLSSPFLASYASANAFLDAMAHHRRANGQPALSVNWGWWDEIGMVARSQREQGRGFAPQGMRSFSPSEGLQALELLLQQGAVQTAVMPVNWAEWSRFHPATAKSPLLAHLVQKESESRQAAAEDEGAESGINPGVFFEADEADRLPLLEEYLTQQVSRVLRIPAESLDISQPLNNLGMDSLMAVELRNHIEANLGVMLPVAQLLQDPNIAKLRDVLYEQLASGAELATTTAAEQGGNGQVKKDDTVTRDLARETLDKVDELSDEEVEAMLSSMLKGQKDN